MVELSDHILKETVEAYFRNGKSKKATAEDLGMNRATIQRRIKKAVKLGLIGIDDATAPELSENETVEIDYGPEAGYVHVNSLTICTLEQALEVSKVDLDEWEVDRHVINSWGVTMKDKHGGEPVYRTNYQVKVWLKRKQLDLMKEATERLIGRVPNIEIPKYFISPPKQTGIAGEIAPYDAHFGKFAWGKETMLGNQDVDIMRKIYLHAIESGLKHISIYNPEKIFYIVGQDLMHFENVWGITPIGQNRLDMDSRLPKLIDSVIDAVIQGVGLCRQVAPVDVIGAPGNHDMHAIIWITKWLKRLYETDKHVNVDAGDCNDKRIVWGDLLIGFTHNAEGRKLAPTVNQLPQLWPQDWGMSKIREWHVGHLHKKGDIKFAPVQTVGGVLVRRLSALSTVDYWHFDNKYIDAIPAGESFLLDKRSGVVANYTNVIRWEDFDK